MASASPMTTTPMTRPKRKLEPNDCVSMGVSGHHDVGNVGHLCRMSIFVLMSRAWW